LRFRAPFGGLESTYSIFLRLIGKRVVDFLFVLIELLSLAVTAAKSKNRLKIGILEGVGQYLPNFHVEGDVLYQSFSNDR